MNMQILYVATVEAGKLLKMAFNAAKETAKEFLKSFWILQRTQPEQPPQTSAWQ